MNKAVVSVIVAVYQAEAYLHRCVDSILSQTFVDFELLLIDDGSTDRSREICDEYAKKDSRVKVIHKQNEGLSVTRQVGIDCTIGEYTIFCDPDDWYDNNMLEELIREAELTSADIVLSDLVMESNVSSRLCKQKPRRLEASCVLNELHYPISPNVCNKLVRLDCYTRYNVKYPKELRFLEDLFVMIQFFTQPIRVAYLPKALYHYDTCSNTNSLTKKIDVNVYMQSVSLFDKTFDNRALVPLNKLKTGLLWFIYKANPKYFDHYDQLYPEVNSFLLVSGMKHPFKWWHHLVLAFHRYNLGWLGELLYSLEKCYVKIRNSIKY